MAKVSDLLKKAADLRDRARRALRLAAGVLGADRARLMQYGEELGQQAAELESEAAAEDPSRPAEPQSGRSRENGRTRSKRRGPGSDDTDPHS